MDQNKKKQPAAISDNAPAEYQKSIKCPYCGHDKINDIAARDFANMRATLGSWHLTCTACNKRFITTIKAVYSFKNSKP